MIQENTEESEMVETENPSDEIVEDVINERINARRDDEEALITISALRTAWKLGELENQELVGFLILGKDTKNINRVFDKLQ